MIEKQYFLERIKEVGLLLNQRISREQGEALWNYCHRFTHESFNRTMDYMIEHGGYMTTAVMLPLLKKFEPDLTPPVKDEQIYFDGECNVHDCLNCEVDVCKVVNDFIWPLFRRMLNREITYDQYKEIVTEKFPIIFSGEGTPHTIGYKRTTNGLEPVYAEKTSEV